MAKVIFCVVVFVAMLGCVVGCREKIVLVNNEEFIYSLIRGKRYIPNVTILISLICAATAFWCYVSYKFLFDGSFDILVMILFIMLTFFVGTLISILYCCLLVKEKKE